MHGGAVVGVGHGVHGRRDDLVDPQLETAPSGGPPGRLVGDDEDVAALVEELLDQAGAPAEVEREVWGSERRHQQERGAPEAGPSSTTGS